MRRPSRMGMVSVVAAAAAVGVGVAAFSGSDPVVRPPVTTSPSSIAATPVALGFSDADNGRTVAVDVGQRMTVILHSSNFVFAAPSDTAVLRADGVTTVTPGGTSCIELAGSGCGTVVASFVGVAPGDAELRADRTGCAEPTCGPADARWRVLARVADPGAAPATTTTIEGGAEVTGTVRFSPTCPVEQDPPDPACAPRPGPATIELARPDGIVVAQARAGDDGAFTLSVTAGAYTVLAFGPSGGGGVGVGGGCQADPPEVVIEPNTSTTVTVSCDTGIR